MKFLSVLSCWKTVLPAILFVCAACLSSVSLAETIFVANALENGDGSHQSPFNDLQYALDAVEPGDTIFLKAGHYTGSWSTSISGTPDQRIYLDGESPHNTKINGCSLADNEGLVVLHSYYSIARLSFINHVGNGLTVVGGSTPGEELESIHIFDACFIGNGSSLADGGDGLYIENAMDVFIGDVVARSNYINGVTLANCEGGNVTRSDFSRNKGVPESEGLAFINCEFFQVTDCSANRNSESGFDSSIFEGIASNAGNIDFRNCVAKRNGGEGFSVSGTLTGTQTNLQHRFIRCLAVGNLDGGFGIYQRAEVVDIINCTAIANQNRGVTNVDGGNDIWVINSVFALNRAIEGELDDAGGDPAAYTRADHNYWFRLAPGFEGVRSSSDVTGSFSSLNLTRKFTPRSSSPLVDAGTDEFEYDVLFKGNAPDIGWAEFRW